MRQTQCQYFWLHPFRARRDWDRWLSEEEISRNQDGLEVYWFTQHCALRHMHVACNARGIVYLSPATLLTCMHTLHCRHPACATMQASTM